MGASKPLAQQRRGPKPAASNSSNLSGTGREDGSSMAQSRIYEEEEESKHMSSNENDERDDDDQEEG